jgi:chromate transporter
VWLSLGLQSFGGGVATLALIRRAVVDRHRWISEAEFSRYWALVQLAPGINLLALTILIGRKTGGAAGIALALLGLLLPSAGVALLLTAFYAHVQHLPAVRAAVRSMIPATVGLGLLTAVQIARPLLRESRREGRLSFALSLLLVAGSGLLLAWGHWPVVAILLTAAALGTLAHWRKGASSDTEKP